MRDELVNKMMYNYMNGFINMAKRCGLNSDTTQVSNTSYPFIPNLPSKMSIILLRVEKYLYNKGIKHDPAFLDAGCGIGNIMLLAYIAGFDVSGIDLNPHLIQMANYLIGEKSKLDIADILSYNKYGEFDVIYYYRPLSDSTLERKFENKVENDAKVGAVLITSLKSDKLILKDKRFKRLKHLELAPDTPVFQKICATV